MRYSHRTRFFFLFLVGATLPIVTIKFWPELRWQLAGPRLEWPTVEAYEFHFDLQQAGRFEGRVRIDMSRVDGESLTLLLNKNLSVLAATVEGQAVSFSHYWPLPSRYHSEGRVLQFVLPRAPANGQVALSLTYAGKAEQGREGQDWRGILFVDKDEARMCEQTVFYP